MVVVRHGAAGPREENASNKDFEFKDLGLKDLELKDLEQGLGA
jgi:hypothetical protein